MKRDRVLGNGETSMEDNDPSGNDGDGSDEYECPTCGQSGFVSERGVNIHHTKVHDGGASPETGDHHCPHDGCSRRFETRQGLGQHHSQTHGSKLLVELVCEWCGDDYTRHPFEAEESRFCSNVCKGEDMATRTGEENRRWKGGRRTMVCEQCGDAFTETPGNVNRFCSRRCKDLSLILDTAPYGKGWDEEKREAVRERDGRQCTLCGVSEDFYIERTGVRLDVHHVRRARYFQDSEERNAMSNLTTLCRSCHRRTERFSPLVPSGIGQPSSD